MVDYIVSMSKGSPYYWLKQRCQNGEWTKCQKSNNNIWLYISNVWSIVYMSFRQKKKSLIKELLLNLQIPRL